jgi:SNF2 family DNA or RNA helicase
MSLYETVLFDYQKDAVDRIVARRSILLADQPGLGKTVEVLASLEKAGLFDKAGARILILAPVVAVQSAWRDSIEKWISQWREVDIVDISYGTAKQRATRLEMNLFLREERPKVVLANHASLEMNRKTGFRFPLLFEQYWDAVIIDESHVVLPISNDRKLTNFWLGLKNLNFHKQAFRLAVSGTPDRGKLENRYGTYKFLRPEDFATVSRWSWLEHNFWVHEAKVARGRVVKVVGAVKSKAAWGVYEDTIMIRRTKGEVLTDLPPKQYNFVELELYPEQRQDYMLALRRMVDEQADAGETVETASAMVFALRARQIADCQWLDGKPVVGGKSAKLDWLLEWLGERENVKVVVCSQFAQVLHWLKEELNGAGYSADVLDGGASVARRASIQKDFQEGSLQVCLISGRMGVGITLDVADDLIMFDLPYDPDVVEQVEDRVHRASRNHQVTIWNLLAVGSVDQVVAKKLNTRYFVTRYSMDGRRGIDFEKKVLEKIRVSHKMSDVVDNVSNVEGES